MTNTTLGLLLLSPMVLLGIILAVVLLDSQKGMEQRQDRVGLGIYALSALSILALWGVYYLFGGVL